MSVTAGELDVALKMKDGLTPGIQGVDRSAGGLMGTIGKLKGLIVAAFAVAGVAAIAKFAKSSIDYFMTTGAAIREMTRMTNVSTESASILVNQWKRFGVEASSGSTALRFLSKNMYAARDATAYQTSGFKALGISLKDVRTTEAGAMMMRLRDQMSQMTDKTERTALAIKLFGRGGMALMPWLDKAPKEVSEVTKKMRDLGLVWGDKQLDTWGEVKAAQKDNTMMWDAIKFKASAAIMPIVAKLLPLIGKGLMALQPAFSWIKNQAGGLWRSFEGTGKTPFAELGPAAKVFRVIGTAARVQFAAIKTAVTDVVGFFRSHWTGISQAASAVWAQIMAGVRFLVTTFRPAIQQIVMTTRVQVAQLVAVWARIRGPVLTILRALWAGVKVVFALIVGVIKGALNIIAGIIRVVMAVVRGDWSAAWAGVKQIARGAGQVVAAIVRALMALVAATMRNAWNGVRAATSAAWGAIVGAVRSGASRVVSFVRSLPGKIVSALGSLGGLLVSAGASLITGLWSGISSQLSGMLTKVTDMARQIADKVKGALGINSPSKVFHDIGRGIMEGWSNGIGSGNGLVSGAMTSAIAGLVSQTTTGLTGAAFPALAVAGGYGAASPRRSAATASPGGLTIGSVHVHLEGIFDSGEDAGDAAAESFTQRLRELSRGN